MTEKTLKPHRPESEQERAIFWRERYLQNKVAKELVDDHNRPAGDTVGHDLGSVFNGTVAPTPKPVPKQTGPVEGSAIGVLMVPAMVAAPLIAVGVGAAVAALGIAAFVREMVSSD